MKNITATEYTLEEYVGDNTIALIDRQEADGKFKTFVYLADEDDGEVLFDSKDMTAIALRLAVLEQQMKNISPLREKEK